MKKNPENTVAVIVAVALIGLISVQVYWAKTNYKEEEAIFKGKIIKILNSVCDEANEEATCFTLYSKTYINSNEGLFLMKAPWKAEGKNELWENKTSHDSIPMFFNVPEEYKNSPLNRVYKDVKFSTPVTAEILLKFRFDMKNSSPEKEILSREISTENFKEIMKNHEQLLSIYDTLMIDSLIKYQLKSNNIPVRYSYALVKTQNDSVEYSSDPSKSKMILQNGIRTRLTPADMFSYPYDIIFYPENKTGYILKNIELILSLSVGIILLLLSSYLYFIRTIMRQKKLSEMKNDFINNITHELNTPIANISLAYETLIDKGKITTDQHSGRILEIIETETNRLKDNVTRILKISSYEKNGINLLSEEINISELICLAVARFELTIEQKKAVVTIKKPDYPVMFKGDKLHLLNAIENLIDNALKYCNGNCRIEIELIKQGSEIIITVNDNGIGINEKEIDKIFEKFYRVQHGNIQNDRGFGLGLNYVKYVIEASGGKITVSSRAGKGSSFRIILNENVRQN